MAWIIWDALKGKWVLSMVSQLLHACMFAFGKWIIRRDFHKLVQHSTDLDIHYHNSYSN